MRVSAEAFWAEKAGNSPNEFEDSFYPQDPLIAEEGPSFRFAVADGATDTCFSGVWARQLVKAYCEGLFEADHLAHSLPKLQECWREEVLRKGSLPWYVEEKIQEGAFAALVGLTLEGSPESPAEGTWRALALGDSCLFHLRDRDVLQSFPVDDPRFFTNSPLLLSSRPDRNQCALKNLCVDRGEWKAGDSFYLMTDALACWLLQQLQGKRVPWNRLEDFDRRRKRFRPWIERLRGNKVMRNDDVTLVRIEIVRPCDL
jgi:hypothetical protein